MASHGSGTRSLAFAMVGDVTDPSVASGTPYFLMSYAARAGLNARGLKLRAEGPDWKRRRIAWNLARLIRTGQRGGYQFSDRFLTDLWALDPPRPEDAVINMFQLYPEGIIQNHLGPLCFFVDQTLKQMFDTYELGLPDSVMHEALARERDQYHAAHIVFTQSNYAAKSVVADYGVDPAKVQRAVSGANLDPDILADWEADRRPAPESRPLRLVFVGKDWRRKGLDRLIRAIEVARRGGANVSLDVIGVEKSDVPVELAGVSGVTWVGFVDKRHDQRRFIDLVADCDVGCLLSTAEAGGMSLREFCRLGLATLAPNVGGSPEYVIPDASVFVGAEDGTDYIAAIIAGMIADRDRLARMKDVAWKARMQASWDAPVAVIAARIAQV